MSSENAKESTAQTGVVALVGGIVGGILGAIVGAVVVFQTIEPTSHDEPIIIEEGSVLIDFSPEDNKADMENVNGNGEWINRNDGFEVKSVRMWKRTSPASAWYEELCNGSRCKIDNKQLELELTGGKKLKFSWAGHGSPIKLHGGAAQSLKQPYAQQPHLVATYDSALKIDRVKFKANGVSAPFDIDLRTADTDEVVVKLCAKLNGNDCTVPR